MAEDRKKKRIARIGNMGSVHGTAKVHSDDGLAQADCNLVYDIMQSMNKSQIMSYQELQELRSKENGISRTDYIEQNSSKKIDKTLVTKQTKKLVPEKTFPLMAKCQKSMKYLKKNRCIPKPRAHVGFIPRPPQRPLSNFTLNDSYNNHSVSVNTSRNESSMKIKQSSKKSRRSPEMNGKRKKPKISQSVDSSCDKISCQAESSEKDPKLISNDEIDSDNEFEQFLLEHHPSKCTTSSNDYSSDSSAKPRKVRKNNKTKRKKRKQVVCRAKMIKNKITRTTLTESGELNESLVEHDENNCKKTIGGDDCTAISCNRRFPSKRFQRIVEYDDSASDTYANDSGTVNYDSFNSSEDENILVTKSSNNESVNHVIDLDDSEKLDVLPAEPCPVATSTSLSELKDTMYCDKLKLKCKIPCYVVIKRDPLLDQKAASLRTDNSSVTNTVTDSNLCDDDCIIISEISTNFTSDNSKNTRRSIESRNSVQGVSIEISKSPSVSEVLTDINSMKNKHTQNEKLICNSSGIRLQTETNSLLSNGKSTDIVSCDKDKSLGVQKGEVDEKETRSVTASSKLLSDMENGVEKEKCPTINKTRYSHKNVNSPEYEEKNTLNYEKSTSTEKEAFNVQILSVKSLNESDVIILSDNDEEKEMKTVPLVNEKNETAADDSDVEIICLDSSVNKEKPITKNVRDVSNIEMRNKVNNGVNENSSSSSVQPLVLNEDDCIILDDVDIPREEACLAKCIGVAQRNSHVNGKAVDIVNNERKNSNNSEAMAISNNPPDLNKQSILKILGTIDINCIKKVLNETISTDTPIDKNSGNVSAEAENSCENFQVSNGTADSFPAKQSQNDACTSQQQVSMDASTPFVDSSKTNKISSVKTSPIDTCEENIKSVKNSNVLHSTMENVSQNETIPVKSNNASSSNNYDKSTTFSNSNANLSVPKLSVSEKDVIVSSHKTELKTSLHSRKNQQLLPRCTKIESNESGSDVLDILAAKSIKNLDEKQKKTILPLVELYQAEYKKFMEIKSTEKNVTAGLKLLEENQARKLMHISSSIKNIAKNDVCFHKVKNEIVGNKIEHKDFIKSSPAKTDESLDEIKKSSESVTQPSHSNWLDIKKDDKVRIFHPSIVEGAAEILKSQSFGPSSSDEVYKHLINSVCAECGGHATFACSGCAKVLYCSEKCGISYWSKGHFATCGR